MPRNLLLWMAVASGVAFIAHGIDKWASVRGGRRISERTLHLLEFLGGWPGALLAMALVRHKTRKPSYLVVTAGIVVLHAVLGYAAWRAGWREG